MLKVFKCDQCGSLYPPNEKNIISIRDGANRDTGRSVWFCSKCTKDFMRWELDRIEDRLGINGIKKLKLHFSMHYGTTNMNDITDIINSEINATATE